MQITNEFLKEKNACIEGIKWSQLQEDRDAQKFIRALLEDNHFDWANWVIVRCLKKETNIKYAIFAAEFVIDIYEKKYPEDTRPRKAIQAAKDYLDGKITVHAADAAANAAYAAADAAYAAADAAAAYAAYAAYATYAAAAAYFAARAAADAAYAATRAEIEKLFRGMCGG